MNLGLYSENDIVMGDCLEIMAVMPDECVDLVVTDPPYEKTACTWDSIIPLDKMWEQLMRLIKPQCPIVIFGKQPFTSKLILSNEQWFKYCWVWIKSRPFDFFNCKNKPLGKHEDICVFSNGTVANCSPRRMVYNPQGLVKVDRPWKRPRFYNSEHKYNRPSSKLERVIEFTNYPNTVLYFPNPNRDSLHPTQKPLALLEYLILTYSKQGDLILDFAMGSGTTAVAADRLGRRWFGCDINEEYVAMALERIKADRIKRAQMEMNL